MDRGDTHWESYDGRKILIKDLEIRHLVNILNWVKETNDGHDCDIYPPAVCQLLQDEAQLRVMRGWAANKGIPKQLDNGEWVVVNQTFTEQLIEDVKSLIHKYKIKKLYGKIMQKKIDL